MTPAHSQSQAVDPAAIAEAAHVLRNGGLAAFPTETVYGVGADATNSEAVARLFATKQRPSFNPLIVHVRSLGHAAELGDFSAMARRLASSFWPGALTIVVPRSARCSVSLLACAGLDTIALRSPSHPVAAQLLDAAGIPIAAPSANRSGRITATRSEHVKSEFGERLDAILDGGPTPLGLESTVIGFEAGQPVVLRPGAVPREDIQAVIGPLVSRGEAEARSPGLLRSHYAPRARVRMNATSVTSGEALLAFGFIGVPSGAHAMLNLSQTGNLSEAAANLFSMMRTLDDAGATAIAVMPIPESGLGEAINDRLRRASAPRGTMT